MRSRIGLKALGLCALVLGMMAISASGAQAAGEWMVAGKNLSTWTAGLEPKVEGAIEGGTAGLLATLNGLDMELLCSTGELVGIKIKPGGTTTEGDLKFTGCVAYNWDLNAEKKYTTRLNTACTPHSTGQAAGTILTEPGTGTLVLHKFKDANGTELSKTVVLILPTNAAMIFAKIEMGELCAFGEEFNVFGQFVAEDCEGKGEVEQVTHLITEEKELTKLFALSETHPAHIDGSANAKLGGAHANQNWSGL